MKLLTLSMDDLTDCNDIFVVKRAQVFDFTQSCQRKSLIRHLIHDHVQLFQREIFDLTCDRIPELNFIHLAKRAFADFLDLFKVA